MRNIILLFFLLFPCLLFSQSINHWETAVLESDMWRYLEGNYEPDTNWRKINFDDSNWLQGQGGIGCGDGDDSTIINPVTSLYLRKTFTIVDTSDIAAAVLDIDYDDAFVAYLNNVEIARVNVGIVGDHPAYNQTSSSLHEAQMYQGGNPDRFVINNQILKNIILPGNNVLSLQFHNDNVNSSDLTARVFFSFGIVSNNSNYNNTPSWFQAPLIFTSSNLPIVVINTLGQAIVDDPRIVCDMGIIDNGFGNLNSIYDPFNDYNGKISIEFRGSSSLYFDKKSYGLETQDSLGNNNNVSLLGMPLENDWILYAPYSDKSLMRNFLTYNLGIKMGNYSPRTVFCELIVNDEYNGVYILTEKIKRDNDRVDIAKLDIDDLSGDSLTGGYILKIDRTSPGGLYWTSNFPNIGGGSLDIQYCYPDPSVMLTEQLDYIESFIDSFEYALAGPNFTDSLIGYNKYIDVNSFIDLYLINELSKNIDGYRLSTYMYKDRNDNGGKLTMGPFWDYNLGFGNSENCDGGITSGWEVNTGCGYNNPFWFERLLDDTTYQNKLKCRWEYLRERCFHQDSIFNFIDSVAIYLNDAQERNFQKWDILGNYVWPNYYVGNTYQDELQFLKNWIGGRLIWIDNNIPGNCYLVFGCMDPLSCNYNPLANTDDGSCIYSTSSYDTLISNISINWNGLILNTSGDYSITLFNSVGCDSIINLNFTFNTVSAIDNNRNQKILTKVTDILGRETNEIRNKFLLYKFDDGTVEKKIVLQ